MSHRWWSSVETEDFARHIIMSFIQTVFGTRAGGRLLGQHSTNLLTNSLFYWRNVWLIGWGGTTEWPELSPDCSPMEYFFGGGLLTTTCVCNTSSRCFSSPYKTKPSVLHSRNPGSCSSVRVMTMWDCHCFSRSTFWGSLKCRLK